MKVTPHGPNLLKLTRFTAINCFLVREDDGFTLIDTGMAGSADAISAAAREHGLPITRLLLTHAHADHAGSLDALAVQWPEAEVALHARTAQFLAGDTSLRPDEPQDKLRGGYITCDTRPHTLLEPGDAIGSLAVVAAPGHTPEQVAFFDGRDGTLIAGDALQTKAGIAVAGQIRWLFPLPAWATWHKPTALESAKALRALNPARLAVGHGRIIEQPLAEMDEAIRTAEKNLGK